MQTKDIQAREDDCEEDDDDYCYWDDSGYEDDLDEDDEGKWLMIVVEDGDDEMKKRMKMWLKIAVVADFLGNEDLKGDDASLELKRIIKQAKRRREKQCYSSYLEIMRRNRNRGMRA